MSSLPKYLVLTGALIMLFLASCESKNKAKDVNVIAVAIVNGRAVSDSEFVLAYEYTPQTITRLDHYESYNLVLKNIVDRVLLAQEGRTRGYENDETILRFVDYYERAAIARELFLTHVRDSIQVTDDETRLAYQASKMTLFVKHYEFSTEMEADRKVENLSALIHTPIMNGLKMIDHPEFGTVNIVNWNDLNQELELFLYELEIKQPSNPIERKGKYHIYNVLDIEQDLFATESDYLLKKSSLTNVIRRRKEHAAAYNYVRQIMTPEQLRFKSKGLKKLADWLWKTYQEIPQDLRQEQFVEIPYQLGSENTLLNEPLAAFVKDDWSIKDFLFYYTVKPLPINYNSIPTVTADIKNAIAIYARDFVMSEQGISEGLADRPAVIKEKEYWKEQLMAEKVRRDIYANMARQYEQDEIDHDRFSTQLSNYLTVLRNTADITVDTSALYSIATSSTGLARKIDFVSTLLP
ncbi:MAG: hypothetical protein V3U16_01470 [Candidatus Neomarinimicrobiota bacterium]